MISRFVDISEIKAARKRGVRRLDGGLIECPLSSSGTVTAVCPEREVRGFLRDLSAILLVDLADDFEAVPEGFS